MALAVRHLRPTDRYVRSARLTLDAEAPRQRLAFMLEESLRLCSLPGEEQGWVYYFRSLHIPGLPADGDRQVWLRTVQQVIQEQAPKAIHGCDAHAETSDVVYFHSCEEACEALLALLADGITPTAWYWSHVSGVASTDRAATAIAVIDRLATSPAGWAAAAAAVLAISEKHDIVSVMKVFPEHAVRRWVRQFGAPECVAAARVSLSEHLAAVLARTSRAFDVGRPEPLWLACLAVIASRPSTLQDRSVVAAAQATLRTIIAMTKAPLERTSEPGGDNIWQLRDGTMAPPLEQAAERGAQSGTRTLSRVDAQCRSSAPFGETTCGAGLYFLLNTLRYLRGEQEEFSLRFLARLFLRAAAHARIAADDPILRWPHQVESETEAEPVDDRLVRVWLLKIRRWCWHEGRVSVREIVNRRGYVTLTRTDLDVSMDIESADVRIRRLGLDLDPGWLPWFGRVVRFHYRYRGDLCD